MLKNLLSKRNITNHVLILFVVIICSCKKIAVEEPEKEVEKITTFSYEVNCDYCDITYTDKNNQSKTIKNNIGKWTYNVNTKITFNLKLVVKTVLTNYQTIQAYILKDGEVVYGNLGYNTADLAYNPSSSQGTANFGIYISTGSSGGSGSGGSGTGGGSPNQTSSVCGAKNKTGGYCKRVVIGGGRCWQH